MFKSQFVSVTKKVVTKGVIIKGVYCTLTFYLTSKNGIKISKCGRF
jgi:hypothetical protein